MTNAKGANVTDQLTEDQASEFYHKGRWEAMSLEERARFQFSQDRLCMPFGIFHEAAEKALGRPVWTHEFIDLKRLLEELDGRHPRATMSEIMNSLTDRMRPDQQLIMVGVTEPSEEPLSVS